MTPWDYETARRTLYGEARNQPLEEMIAIAWVIRTRAERPGKTWWGDSVAEVCMKVSKGGVHQFSCWNAGDPNRVEIVKAQDGNPKLEQCGLAVRMVFEANVPNPMSGATHYFTVARPGWAKVWPPSWAKKMRKVGRVHAHEFYEER
jgi:N-acetylmuramoyl-L-alanine amidase